MSAHRRGTLATPTRLQDVATQMSAPMVIQTAPQLQPVSQTAEDHQCAKVPVAFRTHVVLMPSAEWRTTGPTASVRMDSLASPTTTSRDVLEFLPSVMMTELAQHPWFARNAGADLPAQQGKSAQLASFVLKVTASRAVCKTRTASTRRFAWNETALLAAGKMKIAATMKLVS